MIKQIVAGISMVMVLALGLAASQALATTFGVDYSPYHGPGQAPGSSIPNSQFVTDLQQIAAQGFGYIKTYGCDPVLAQIVPLISQNNINLKVAVGIYESSNPSDNTAVQIQEAIHLAQTYPSIVNMVVVGNECIANEAPSEPNPVSLSALITDLTTVKNALPNTTVTTCLTYKAAQDLGSTTNSLLSHIDNIMVNIYPFYGGVAIGGALANLQNAYNALSLSNYGKPAWVGETGWPSAPANTPNGAAVPGLANEQAYTKAVLGASASLPYARVYLFEAYDEAWKTENAWGPYWGLWNADNTNKVFPLPLASPIPLPPSALLLGSVLLSLVGWRRFRKS